MVIDLSAYRQVIKPQVKMWCDARSGSPVDHVGNIALATTCHIIAVCYFVGELYGFTPALVRLLNTQLTFYDPDHTMVIEGMEVPHG